jgi:UDP-sulfoquinovose synthase
MRVLICGGDGYLGWPTAMYLSNRGHAIGILDNFAKRSWEAELNARPLIPVSSLFERIKAWKEVTGHTISMFVNDLCDFGATKHAISDFCPDAIVHFGEQPSAPYSMIDHQHAVSTQINNVVGTLNLLWAIAEVRSQCHLIKLGTMGEYGTPNIDIEEGWIEVEHKGRKDMLPFPCQPGSFYHLSKVHSSHNLRFACKLWGMRLTELNQGVVYGIDTEETLLDERFETSFHYDEIFGTVLNRFCVQAVAGIPLTVYGSGTQERSFLNINDTLRCVEIALENKPEAGEYRVFNQFTELFGVKQLAELVKIQAGTLGIAVKIESIQNPRLEQEDHYYKPVNDNLLKLGLKPRFLSNVLLDSMLLRIQQHRQQIRNQCILPHVRWQDGMEENIQTAATRK